MKKILLSSAAVIAFAGAAVADVTISGDAELGYNEEIKDGVYWGVGLSVAASTELNNGWTAAGSLDIDLTTTIQPATQPSTFGLGSVDSSDWVLSLTSDMGGLYFGDTAFAADEYWSGTGNMEDDSFDGHDDDGPEDATLRLEYTGGMIAAAVSARIITASTTIDGMSAHVKADLGGVTLAAAYQDDTMPSGEVFGVTAAASMGGIDFKVAHADASDGDGNTSTGASVSYPMGNITLGGFYVAEDVEEDNYGVSVDYSEGAVSVDAFFHGGTDEDAGVNVSFDAGNGVNVFAGWSDDDGSYVGGTLDLGGDATLLVSWGDDSDNAENDEIGPEKFLTGVNVNVSIAF